MEYREQQDDRLQFLSGNCGPIIKHLLLSNRKDAPRKPDRLSYAAMLKLPVVSFWKANIPTTISNATILGSGDSCFENSFGKLLSFGLDTADLLSDELLEQCVLFLQKAQCRTIYDSLARFVVAGYLLAAGSSDGLVQKIVKARINVLYDFVVGSPLKYDIYIESDHLKVPRQYRSNRLVNPILYQENELLLPLIYDVFVFSSVYAKLSADLKQKVDAVVDYIGDSRYQSFDYGYGLIQETKSKYHLMGWSAHLPLFNNNLSGSYFKKGLLHRMVVFSRFKSPAIQEWISRALLSLADFKVNDLQYSFPGEYLPEIKNSYFMNGRHMGLGEDRRQKLGRVVESTYYVHSIIGHGAGCCP